MKNKILFASILLMSSVQAQTQWYEIPSNTSKHLRAIDFPSVSVGYIVGDSGVILKSTNGGQSWNSVSYTGIPFTPQFTDVEFYDEMNGFVVVKESSGSFYRTTDGGLTWTANSSQSNMCDKRCMYVSNADDYFVAGAGCFQSAMIDEHDASGWTEKTVNYQSFNPLNYVTDIDFAGNIGIAAVNDKYLLRSADSGQTWDTIATGISDLGVHTSVHFADLFTCYAGYDDNGAGFGVLVSLDGGLTWQQDFNSATFYYPSYYGFTSAANGDVYCGARPYLSTGGLIFERDVNGWTFNLVDEAILALASIETDRTFGVGENGLIVCNTQLSGAGLSEEGPVTTLEVFPNPATDWVHVVEPETGAAVLALFDLQGNKVEVPMRKEGDGLDLNVSALSSGVYVLNWTNGTRTSQTRIVKY